MKKIFINGLSALLGGGQTYLINLFGEVPDAEIHLALPDELRDLVPRHKNIRLVPTPIAKKSVVHRLLWENLILPRYLRENEIDIYYQPSGTLPLRRIEGTKTAIAFRNMLPFAKTETERFNYGWKRTRYWLLRQFLSRGFRQANLVIFISKYAKSVIDQCVPKREGRDVVVYHGLDEKFRLPQSRPASLPPGEYVLYVSILNYYKAQVEVVRAWSMLRKQRPTSEKLVLLGPENSSYGELVRNEIKKLNLENEVLVIAKVPHSELAGYYQHAKINLFASSCENCPNVLIEKLAAGRPTLVSNYEPMPEIAQSAALYFDPYRPEDLCQLILNTIDESHKLDKLGEAALLRSQSFSWEKTRRETWQALLSLE